MNELLEEFDKFNEKQKIGLIIFGIITIALYPQILILIFAIAAIYILAKYLPTIMNEYNNAKNEYRTKNTNNHNSNTSNNTSRFCSNCGIPISNSKTVNFCPNCGNKISV